MALSESQRRKILRAGVDAACLEKVDDAALNLVPDLNAITNGIPPRFFPAISAILTKMLSSVGLTYRHPDFHRYFDADYFAKSAVAPATERMARARPDQAQFEGEA